MRAADLTLAAGLLLAGLCVALAALIVFSVVNAILKERGKGKKNGRNQN